MALRPQRPQSRAEQIAQRDAAQNEIFMREVDEAVRQDEMVGLFKRYGVIFSVGVVAVLVALAGYLWWDHTRKASAGDHGERFVMALDRLEAGQAAEADKQLAALVADSSDGTSASARLMRAGIALRQNRAEDAAKLFAEVAGDQDAPKPMRDLANLREVALRFDALPPQQVIDRLKPLAIAGNPWFGSAGELVSIAYIKQGRNDLAGPLLAAVAKDEQTPESVRRRTRQLAGLLGVDAIDDPVKAMASVSQGEPAPAPAPVPAPAPSAAQ